MDRREQRGRRARIIQQAEWVFSAVALLLVLGVIGLLVRASFVTPTPPEVFVTLEEPVWRDGRAHLRFRAENRGDLTAGAVAISVSLAGEEPETRRLVIDYVPGRSEVEGGFYVDGPERPLDPVAVVEGYVDP